MPSRSARRQASSCLRRCPTPSARVVPCPRPQKGKGDAKVSQRVLCTPTNIPDLVTGPPGHSTPNAHTGRRLEWRGWRWTQRQGSMKPRLVIELHRSAHTAGWFEAAESAKAHIAIAGRLLVFGAPIAHAVCAILASALLGILLCACAGAASICASSVLMLPWLVGVALLPQTERRPAT